MTKPNSTLIVMLQDESGSMQGLTKDVIGGFNTFVTAQKEVPGECKLTLVTFNHAPTVKYNNKSIQEIPPFTFVPNGSTSLYDAIGTTIDAVGKELAQLPESDRPSKVMFVIMTDGEENSSQTYNGEKIKEMIEHQTQKYSWEFVYLGANQDAFTSAKNIGISINNVSNYSATSIGTRDSYSVVSNGILRSRTTGTSFHYTTEEKKLLDPTNDISNID